MAPVTDVKALVGFLMVTPVGAGVVKKGTGKT